MSIILLTTFEDIDKNSIINPFLEFGIVGSLVLVFGFVIYKMYFAHKAELLKKDIDRDIERAELIKKLDDARADALNDIKGTSQQIIDIADKFNAIANELRTDYYRRKNA